MKTITKGGLATLTLAAGVFAAGAAFAESYDSRGFAYGSHEAWQAQHCTYNVCNIDYTRMPNWPSNPMYGRRPDVRVYEYPGYYTNEPPPPEEEEYPYDEE